MSGQISWRYQMGEIAIPFELQDPFVRSDILYKVVQDLPRATVNHSGECTAADSRSGKWPPRFPLHSFKELTRNDWKLRPTTLASLLRYRLYPLRSPNPSSRHSYPGSCYNNLQRIGWTSIYPTIDIIITRVVVDVNLPTCIVETTVTTNLPWKWRLTGSDMVLALTWDHFSRRHHRMIVVLSSWISNYPHRTISRTNIRYNYSYGKLGKQQHNM